jgi:hypothetical protein
MPPFTCVFFGVFLDVVLGVREGAGAVGGGRAVAAVRAAFSGEKKRKREEEENNAP